MVIVQGKWEIEENEFVDIEPRDVRVEVYKTGIALGIDMTDRKKLCGLYDAFFKRLEKNLDCQIKVIGVGVSPLPKDYSPKYPSLVLGPPYCYIAHIPHPLSPFPL